MSYFDWLHAWGCLGEIEGRKLSTDNRIGLKPIRKQTLKKTSLRSALKDFAVKHMEDIAIFIIVFLCVVHFLSS